VRASRATPRTPLSIVLVVATLATALVVSALVPPVGPAQAQSSAEEQLAEARSRLERIERDLDAAEAEAGDADVELADADARLREVEGVVNDTAAAVETQRVALADATARLAAVESEADALEAAFRDRIARLYKVGPVTELELLLTGGTADEAIARNAFLTHIAESDSVDLERLAAARIAVDAERERVDAERARMERLLAEQEELLAEVAAIRQRRALAAAEAREQVRLLEEEQDDLVGEQERLETLIREQQEAERRRQAEERRRQQASQSASPSPGGSSGSSGGAVSGSGYAWPMCAPVTSEYGPRWGRLHAGIDQGASPGTPIGASKAGRVIFAGWQGGYGRLVLIDHGDGVVTAYAHMSGFAVGQGTQVSQRQTIGYVGSSGNSTGPHLHTEFRVNGRAVNPRQYLRGSPC
jgi:murein DD-endopeptidase MepM/ murein hydrolase activator NlpD